VRTFASISALISKDTDQRQKYVEELLSFDDDDATTSSTFNGGLITLAANATNIVVPFGGVTLASTVLIIAYQEISVKFNGTGSPAIPVRPVLAKANGAILSNLQRFDQPGLVLWRGKVTSIHLGNPNTSLTAQVYVAVTGEAT